MNGLSVSGSPSRLWKSNLESRQVRGKRRERLWQEGKGHPDLLKLDMLYITNWVTQLLEKKSPHY